MTRCKLRVIVEEELAKPRPELDHCAEHGVWFDRDELATVLAKVRAKVSPQGGRVAGWPGNRGGFGWWRTGM
jgi:Zn-finger nucleic acid-binding protein